MDTRQITTTPEPREIDPPFVSRSTTQITTSQSRVASSGAIVHCAIDGDVKYFTPFARLDNFIFDHNSVEKGLGFQPHFHSGIQTVTYVMHGALQHEDHLGNKGVLRPGDAQVMASGRGIVHSEMPVTNHVVEGMQLWVNMPRESKSIAPYYNELSSAALPEVTEGGVWAKIIMGNAMGRTTPSTTVTPVDFVHYKLQPNTTLQHVVPPHYNAFLYVLEGDGVVGAEESAIAQRQCAFYKDMSFAATTTATTAGENIGVTIKTHGSALELILIAGEPLLDKPHEVVQYGPMIMNSVSEVQKKFQDFQREENGFGGAHSFMAKWEIPGVDVEFEASYTNMHKKP